MIVSLAKRQAGTIAKVVGRPEQDVRDALQQGSKLLPELMGSKDGGVDVLRRMGVSKDFLDDMYKRYGKFAGKIPGMSRNTFDSTYKALSGSLAGERPASRTQKKQTSFDKKKYPLVT